MEDEALVVLEISARPSHVMGEGLPAMQTGATPLGQQAWRNDGPRGLAMLREKKLMGRTGPPMVGLDVKTCSPSPHLEKNSSLKDP